MTVDTDYRSEQKHKVMMKLQEVLIMAADALSSMEGGEKGSILTIRTAELRITVQRIS